MNGVVESGWLYLSVRIVCMEDLTLGIRPLCDEPYILVPGLGTLLYISLGKPKTISHQRALRYVPQQVKLA